MRVVDVDVAALTDAHEAAAGSEQGRGRDGRLGGAARAAAAVQRVREDLDGCHRPLCRQVVGGRS